MIGRVFPWLRVVLPPKGPLGLFIVLYLTWTALYLVWPWWLGIPSTGEPFLTVRNAVVGLACACYGAFRVFGFHPAFRGAYFQWLEQTPWTSQKPLPAGPVHLVPQDLVLLAVALLLLHDCATRFLLVPLAFLILYLLCMCLSFWLTGERWTGYALAFGLGLAVRVSMHPLIMLAITGLLYPLAYFGLRRSLARFPWEEGSGLEAFRAHFGSERQTSAESALGWPWDHLQPTPTNPRIRPGDGILSALLVGWCAYAVFSAVPDPEFRRGFPRLLFHMTLAGSVLFRVVAYCWNYRPPISLWGRIRTGRWIVPGYDQVFVAPICTCAVAAAAWLAFRAGFLPDEVAIPVSISLMLTVALTMGPTLNQWRLTGSHRIVPEGRARRDFVEH